MEKYFLYEIDLMELNTMSRKSKKLFMTLLCVVYIDKTEKERSMKKDMNENGIKHVHGFFFFLQIFCFQIGPYIFSK